MNHARRKLDPQAVDFGPSRTERAGLVPWALCFLFLVLLRLLLPAAMTDAMETHRQIVASLLAGQN